VALRKSHSTLWKLLNSPEWLSGRASQRSIRDQISLNGSPGEPFGRDTL
jgi:hypothetical protein